jgi:hypothetical protein
LFKDSELKTLLQFHFFDLPKLKQLLLARMNLKIENRLGEKNSLGIILFVKLTFQSMILFTQIKTISDNDESRDA